MAVRSFPLERRPKPSCLREIWHEAVRSPQRAQAECEGRLVRHYRQISALHRNKFEGKWRKSWVVFCSPSLRALGHCPSRRMLVAFSTCHLEPFVETAMTFSELLCNAGGGNGVGRSKTGGHFTLYPLSRHPCNPLPRVCCFQDRMLPHGSAPPETRLAPLCPPDCMLIALRRRLRLPVPVMRRLDFVVYRATPPACLRPSADIGAASPPSSCGQVANLSGTRNTFRGS